MVDFSLSKERADWLEAQTNDAAAVFAARAALRIVPAISADLSRMSTRKNVLRVFRAVAAAWATAPYPGYREILREAARAALSGLGNLELPAPDRAAAYAAVAAAAGDAKVNSFSSTSVGYSLDAAAVNSEQALDVTLEALETDAKLLEQNFSSVTLANSQLWPRRLPDWVLDKWSVLKSGLLRANEGWVVWTDWYEERLKGHQADQAIEIARVTILNETWDKKPNVLNSSIRTLFEERGVWRYAIAEEPEREHLTIAQAVSQPNNDYDLERRLAALSVEKLNVIRARLALRAVPLIGLSSREVDTPEFGAACLSMFCGVAGAWYGARFPAQNNILIQI